MKCPKCRSEIPDGSRFCRHCGAQQNVPQNVPQKQPPEDGTMRVRPPMEDGTMRVRPPQQQRPPQGRPQQQQRSQQRPPQQRPSQGRPSRKRRSNGSMTLVIVCIAVVLLLMAALGIFVVAPLFSSDDDAAQTRAEETAAPRDENVPDDDEKTATPVPDVDEDETEETDERPAAYAEAASLLGKGEYEAAIAAFDALGDYEDAPQQCSHAHYAYAGELMAQKAYDAAQEHFLQAVEDYEDAAAQAEICAERLAEIQENAPRKEPSISGCGQFVLAELSGSSAVLRYYEKTPVGWELLYTFNATAGKNGISYSKAEGDNCTPAGEYEMLFCFGETVPNTQLDFFQTDSNSVFVDDSSSAYYNTLQLDDSSAWSSREDLHSRYFQNGYSTLIYIGYNGDGQTPNNATAGRGSMVTLCGKSGTLGATGGCIDISSSDMTQLLSQLDSAQHPCIIITEAS